MPIVGKYGKHVIQVPIVGKYRPPELRKHEAMAWEFSATVQECRQESVALSSRHDF